MRLLDLIRPTRDAIGDIYLNYGAPYLPYREWQLMRLFGYMGLSTKPCRQYCTAYMTLHQSIQRLAL